MWRQAVSHGAGRPSEGLARAAAAFFTVAGRSHSEWRSGSMTSSTRWFAMSSPSLERSNAAEKISHLDTETTSASAASPRHRFTRGNSVSSAAARTFGQSTPLADTLSHGSLAEAAEQLAVLTVPQDLNTNQALINYLQRVQRLVRQHPSPIAVVTLQHEISKILFASIKGLDGAGVISGLQTLRILGVDGAMPAVQDLSAWLSLYGLNLTPVHLEAALDVLNHYRSPIAQELVLVVLQRRSFGALPTLPATRGVPLLTALLPSIRLSSLPACQDTTEAASLDAASSSPIAVAEAMRDTYNSHEELVQAPASHLGQLLCALWTFRQCNMHLCTTEAARDWLAFEHTLCNTMCQPTAMEALTLMDLLLITHAAAIEWRRRSLEDSLPSPDTQEALQKVLSAVSHQLDAIEQSCCDWSADVNSAGPLPKPMNISEVCLVWVASLRSAEQLQSVADALPAESNDPSHSAVVRCANSLARLRFTLSTILSTCFDQNPGNIAFAQVAAALAHTLLESWIDHAGEQTVPSETETEEQSSAMMPDLAELLPRPLLEALITGCTDQLQSQKITWTPQTVRDVMSVLGNSRDTKHRDCALNLATRWYQQLQESAREGARIQPLEILGFFLPEFLRKETKGVAASIKASLSRWSVSEVLFFFSHIGPGPRKGGGVEGLTVLRESGKLLSSYALKASASQLTGLVECYGEAQVRNDEFCEAAANRLSELLHTTVLNTVQQASSSFSSFDLQGSIMVEKFPPSEPSIGDRDVPRSPAVPTVLNTSDVSLSQLARLLRSFALMEWRQVTPFIDAALHVQRAAEADQGTSEEITQLIAAYAKMLIWNYPTLRALTERLCRMSPTEVSLSQLVTAQLALLRMDVVLPSLTARLFKEFERTYPPSQSNSDGASEEPQREISLEDLVVQLSVLSRLEGDAVSQQMRESVAKSITERIMKFSEKLPVHEVAEVLMSLARLGKGDSAAFDRLTVRILGMLPKSPPRVMAHVVEAYALAGRGSDAELFTLVADRTIVMRQEMAAVTIGSILSSFAKAGVRHDRLFIEMIPRVRHVATYGTPRDVANVVSAYATVNLWHYKLFSRLADRAIQLRADFRVPELVAMLNAYARVQMRYDRLFTEFAPRIQTLVHLLIPHELVSIVSSYAQLNIPCPPVWKATAGQALKLLASFTEDEARALLEAYASQSFYDEECVHTFTEHFPRLANIHWGDAAEKEKEVILKDKGGGAISATNENASADTRAESKC